MNRKWIYFCLLMGCILVGSGYAEDALNQGQYVLPENRPPEPAPDRFYQEFLNMLSVLGLLMVFLLIIAWVVKRMFNTRMEQMNSASIIKITERRALSPKTTVYVLDIQGKKCLMAESHSGVTYLGDLNTGPSEPKGRTFEDVLNHQS